MHDTITLFFEERKEKWRKKNIKPSMPAQEQHDKNQQCEEIFSLQTWLPNAARRAHEMSFVTHPCTFSHPSARKNKNGKTTSVIAKTHKEDDGYLKTGNVHIPLAYNEAVGNAAALDVYAFLHQEIDGQTLLQHIQENTDTARQLLTIEADSHEHSYDNLRKGFLAMAQSNDEETVITSEKIKQVYFPLQQEQQGQQEYHLLSILTNSAILYELRRRIQNLRFSERAKDGREKRRKNAYQEKGYSEINNITAIGYGGTKPQNISELNKTYGGIAYMLLSVPPTLQRYAVRFPTKNFFDQSIRFSDIDNALRKFDKALKINKESKIPTANKKKAIDNSLLDILDQILQRMYALRGVSMQQFDTSKSTLQPYQKIWLCEQNTDQRQQQNDWLDRLIKEISLWINEAYKARIKKPILLADAELKNIQDFIAHHSELLR